MISEELKQFLIINDFSISFENINKSNSTGYNPITLAVTNGDSSTVEALVHAGADINGADSLGNTAAHIAVDIKNTSLLTWLIHNNANLLLLNNDNKSSHDICVNNSFIVSNVFPYLLYFETLAKQGNVRAMSIVAEIYDIGHFAEKNHVKSAKYYKLAADQGHLPSQFKYALACLHGQGIEQNDAQAAKYFKLAADQGHPKAPSYFGHLCEEGRGVRADPDEARKYYQLAANHGDIKAKESYEKLLFYKLYLFSAAPDSSTLTKILEEIMLTDFEVINKIKIIDSIIASVGINNCPWIIINIFNFFKEQPTSPEVAQIFKHLNYERKIITAVCTNLFSYEKTIEPPYNCVEFSRLDLEESEEFLDPITGAIMNAPVTLYGVNYDLDTLDFIDIQSDGFKRNPFDRALFTLADVKINLELQKNIKKTIHAEIEKIKATIKEICIASRDGKIDKLKSLVDSNPKTCLDETFSKGYSALHYACDSKQIECAKFLIERGASIDLKADLKECTPYAILKIKDSELAKKLKMFCIDLLVERMMNGDISAHLIYAKMLFSGNVIEKNINLAIKYLEISNEKQNAQGYIQLGDIYTYGRNGVDKNIDLAKTYYQIAIERYGDPLGYIKNSILILNNCISSIAIDIDKQIISKLSSEFHPDALLLHGISYLAGIEIKKNEIIANKYFKYAADCGSMLAQAAYATSLHKGNIIPLDTKGAAKYFKMAADQGERSSQYIYACSLEIGEGVKKDLPECAKYLKMAADQGHPKAQHSYALCCENALGVAINFSEAAKYYKMAADQGIDISQFKFAMCCENGKGITLDLTTAARYYKMAADQGLLPAQHIYSFFCYKGIGITPNFIESAKYQKMAADQGFAPAQYIYGVYCEKGEGVEQDFLQAGHYYKMAAEHDLPEATLALTNLPEEVRLIIHAETSLEQYIKTHANLSEYQKNHLRSEITTKCVALGIDTIENFSKQAQTSRVEVVKSIVNPFAYNHPVFNVRLSSETLQKTLDILNSWRIEKQTTSTYIESEAILFNMELQICGACMGLTKEQMNYSFSYVHLEAVCKGAPFNEIKNMSLEQLQAVLLNEKIEDITDKRTGPHNLFLCKLGISLRNTLDIAKETLNVIVHKIECKITGMQYRYEAVQSFDWKEYYFILLQRIENFPNFKEQEEILQAKIISGVPVDLYENDNFSYYHTSIFAMGYSIELTKTYTVMEARAISMGFTPDEAMQSRYSEALLSYLESYLMFNELPPGAAISDLEIFKLVNSLTSKQMIMKTFYEGEDLQTFDIENAHIATTFHEKTKDEDKNQEWYKQMLQKPGVTAFAESFGFDISDSCKHLIGEGHHILIDEWLQPEGNEQEAINKLYNMIKDLNASQAVGLHISEIELNYVKNNFIPKENYLACFIAPENKYTLLTFPVHQAKGISHGLSIDQVQEKWFEQEHNIALQYFKLLVNFHDLNPDNVGELAEKYKVPDVLKGYKDLSWTHIVAYVRGTPTKDLLKTNEIQALGLAIGLSFSQVDNNWLTAYHIDLIMPNINETYACFNYEDIKGLNIMQVIGIDEGLSREEVLDEGYTKYHMVAMLLGYNRQFVRDATSETLNQIITDNYNCEINIDQFIQKYISSYLNDEHTMSKKSKTRLTA